MAATLTSVANGVEVTESSLGGLQYIGSQSDVSVNGAGDGIVVRTPSGNLYQFTNADMGELTAVEAAQTLVAALNAGGSTPVATYTEYKANYVTGVDGDRFITATELGNTLGGAVTAQVSTKGTGWFEFVLPTGTVVAASKVRVVNTVQSDDIASDRFPFGYYIDGDTIIFFISGIDANGANSNGNAAIGSYCSILIEVYP